MRTQPHKGYSTKAWNPPRNWVSPERIALARIPARPPIAGITDFTNNALDLGSKLGIELQLPSVPK